MEEEDQKGMTKKEANKYLSFLIKEWSKAENEVRRIAESSSRRKTV